MFIEKYISLLVIKKNNFREKYCYKWRYRKENKQVVTVYDDKIHTTSTGSSWLFTWRTNVQHSRCCAAVAFLILLLWTICLVSVKFSKCYISLQQLRSVGLTKIGDGMKYMTKFPLIMKMRIDFEVFLDIELDPWTVNAFWWSKSKKVNFVRSCFVSLSKIFQNLNLISLRHTAEYIAFIGY